MVVTDHLRRHRLPCPSRQPPSPTQRHQQTRIIIAMELHDILPDHMLHLVKRASLTGRQVVRQRVQPHVDAISVCESASPASFTSDGNRPRNTRQRPTHAQVLRTLLDQLRDVALEVRGNQLRHRRRKGVPTMDWRAETRAVAACTSADETSSCAPPRFPPHFRSPCRTRGENGLKSVPRNPLSPPPASPSETPRPSGSSIHGSCLRTGRRSPLRSSTPA